MKSALQVLLYIASLLPLAYGLLGMIVGPAYLTDGSSLTPSLDSQFRFLSAFYMGLAPLIWYLTPNIEKHAGILRIIIGILFLGGLSRLYSYLTLGPPTWNFTFGMVLELLLPVLILWQNKVIEIEEQRH